MPKNPPTLRARQAQLTRDEILSAARRLFAEQGYSRTTVRDIAEAAGVSAQTVYDSIGSKQAIVARLNDLIDAEADIAAIVGAAAGSDDPQQILAVPATVTRSILEHCGDILRALVTGAAAEPDLAQVLAEGNRRHVDGARRIVDTAHRPRCARSVGHGRRRRRHTQRHVGRELRGAARGSVRLVAGRHPGVDRGDEQQAPAARGVTVQSPDPRSGHHGRMHRFAWPDGNRRGPYD